MNDFAPLFLPSFARIDDYFGVWAYEPTRFAALWSSARILSAQFAAHAEAAEVAPLAAEKAQTSGGKSITLVRLSGPLMKGRSSIGGTSTIDARREIRAAAADPDVSGILLHIDSPGGTISGIQALAQDIKAARRQKPVWAHAEDTFASAAYWAGSQADRVTAENETTMVGSIGVFQSITDVSAAAEREGVRVLVAKTGPLKGLGLPGTQVTDEQFAHVQSLVDSLQEQFDAAVRGGRGLSAKEMADVRHGGLLPASKAVDARLIDAVQPLGRTINEMTRAISERGRAAAYDAGRTGAVSLPTLRRELPMLAGGSRS